MLNTFYREEHDAKIHECNMVYEILRIYTRRDVCLLTEVAGKAMIEVSVELCAVSFLQTSA